MAGDPTEQLTFKERCDAAFDSIVWLSQHESDAPENTQRLLGLREAIADLLGEPGRTELPKDDWDYLLDAPHLESPE